MGSRQGGTFQTLCILALQSMCIFIRKYVLGACYVRGTVLDAKNKAMNDDININNKNHHLDGAYMALCTVLSVLRVTSFDHPNSPVRSSYPHFTDVETEAQRETRDTGFLYKGNFSPVKKKEQS